jgi:hypothetical protein
MKRISVFAFLLLLLCCGFIALATSTVLSRLGSYEEFRELDAKPKLSTNSGAGIGQQAIDSGEGELSTTLHAKLSAQDYQRGGFRRWRGRRRDPNDRGGVPLWKNEEADPGDVFTFVRIQYESYRGRYRWNTDYPDADLNLSYRLQQLTSIKTDPNGKILRLTDEELFKYPFIYIIEPGGMTLSEEEVVALREYLERGGFLMVDDFWGEDEWANFEYEFKRVFPNRPIEDIPLEHEVFNIVYKIKKKPLIPSVHAYQNGNWTERWDAREAHYRTVKDDSGRLMTVICHNTDLGDGWEQEGTDSGYFEEYSEPYAYPLGINIVTYALTH